MFYGQDLNSAGGDSPVEFFSYAVFSDDESAFTGWASVLDGAAVGKEQSAGMLNDPRFATGSIANLFVGETGGFRPIPKRLCKTQTFRHGLTLSPVRRQ